MPTLSEAVSKVAYFIFFGILLVNLFQKKYGKRGEQKRFATLYLGVAMLGIFIAAGAVIHSEKLFATKLDDFLVLPAVGVILFLLYTKREKTLPFRFRCRRCETKLPAERAFFLDSNLCEECEGDEKEKKTSDGGLS